MAKAIFIVGIPKSQFSIQEADLMRDKLKDQMPDYHVIIYNHGEPDFKFDVLNGEFSGKITSVIEPDLKETGGDSSYDRGGCLESVAYKR